MKTAVAQLAGKELAGFVCHLTAMLLQLSPAPTGILSRHSLLHVMAMLFGKSWIVHLIWHTHTQKKELKANNINENTQIHII